MPWIAGAPPSLFATGALLFGVVMAAPRACERGRRVEPAIVAASPASVIVPFDPSEVETDLDTVPALDDVRGRAWSDLATRVLVTGFANERPSLVENLALAEQRARFVADALASGGVPRRQLVVAAVESSPDDPAGARCHVEVVDPRDPGPPTS